LASRAPTQSERKLVVATRRGDDRAFGELYSRYRDRIGAFILAKVQDHGRAEDIAQEVFISALRRLRASEQQIAFKPWIYEIAKNACIDEFRRCGRAREVPLDADEEFGGGERGLVSIAPTPPAAVESKQQLDDLQGAFGGLSENHHSLQVMREFEGLSYREIGARTGMSRQVVESTLFRARRKLTQEYDEIASGHRCQQVVTMIEERGAQSLAACGIRQRRQLTRHLAYCQPCRRMALQAGVHESLVKPRSIAAKIAALLPFPLSRWPWGGRRAGKIAASTGGSTGAGSLSAGATVAGSAGSSITLGQVAAAATALLIAGAGGAAVTGAFAGEPASHPVRARTSTTHPGGSQSPGGSVRAAGGASAGHSGSPVLRRSSPQPRSHTAHSSAAGTGGSAKSAGPNRPASTSAAGGSTPGASTTRGSSPGSGSPSPSGATAPAKSTPGTARTVTGTAGRTLTGTVRTVTGAAKNTVSRTAGTVTGAAGTVTGAVGTVTGTANRVVGGVTSSAGSTARQAANTVTSAVGSAGSTAQHAASQVTSAAGSAGSTAQRAAGTITRAASSLVP
jgi:RNA polymerase sigma factor (sigma-70 family)